MEFYVYLHRKCTDGTPFYVGKGKGKRAWNFSKRNNKWTNIFNKYGVKVEILYDGLEEKDAFAIEVETIQKLRNEGFDLANLTDGGEGSSGTIVSEHTRKLISQRHKGRVKSEDERLKLKLANLGVKKKPESVAKMRATLTGKKQSEFTKNKRAETTIRNGKRRDNNVYVFYSHDDVFIGTRKQLAEYDGKINPKQLRTLFMKTPNKVSHGWSVLRLNELLILKEQI